MERLFQILAVIFIGIAAFFLWQNNMDAVFITAVLGCCCFFMSIRFQIKERNRKREELNQEKESEI